MILHQTMVRGIFNSLHSVIRKLSPICWRMLHSEVFAIIELGIFSSLIFLYLSICLHFPFRYIFTMDQIGSQIYYTYKVICSQQSQAQQASGQKSWRPRIRLSLPYQLCLAELHMVYADKESQASDLRMDVFSLYFEVIEIRQDIQKWISWDPDNDNKEDHPRRTQAWCCAEAHKQNLFFN